MQNKPNVKYAKIDLNSYITRKYEQLDIWLFRQNKANSNPIKPKTNPIQTQLKPKQTQFKPNKAKNKPNKAKNKPNFPACQDNSRPTHSGKLPNPHLAFTTGGEANWAPTRQSKLLLLLRRRFDDFGLFYMNYFDCRCCPFCRLEGGLHVFDDIRSPQ